MRTCSVFYCKNKVRFEFPSDDYLKQEWLKAIRQPKHKPKRGQGLCVDHFKADDFRTKNISYGKWIFLKVFF